MDSGRDGIRKKHASRLFVPSLAVTSLAVNASNSILILLLLEIASTFQVNEGVAAQLRTVNSIGEIIFALLMSVLVLHFRQKSLLVAGLVLVSLSALGSFLAPTLSLMLAFSFIEGVGTVIVTIMALALIGDSLPLEKKAKAVSWTIAASYASGLIGIPTVGYIAGAGGWRYAFLFFVFPISIVGLFLASLSIPSSTTNAERIADGKGIYLRKLKQVFSNKSAASCLLANLLFTGISFSIFMVAFFRQHFSLSIQEAVLMLLAGGALAIVGSVLTGRLVNKFRTKPLTLAGTLGYGLSVVLMFFAPNLWTALSLSFSSALFNGMAISALPCLALEQVPGSRGIMMSLTRLSASIGYALAPAIGGALLLFLSSEPVELGYQAVGLALGGMSLVAAGTIFFMAKDPTMSSPEGGRSTN